MRATTSRARRPAARASSRPRAAAVLHLSVGEPVARGKAARAEVPALEPRRVRAAAPSGRSD